MRFLFILAFISFTTLAEARSCNVNEYLKSFEGQEKLTSLLERSKSLILSKLEDLGIEENQIQIKTSLPKNIQDKTSGLNVELQSKSLKAQGSKMTLSKLNRDEDCGIEVIIHGGRLLNQESGKDFGSLGRVKEFIRIN